MHLDDRGGARPLPVTDAFWESADQRLEEGHLVSIIPSDGDWTNWEMHPNGDELIYLLSGRMTLVLDTGSDAHARIELQVGEATIVPRSVWHTADVSAPGKALYVTSGRGTEGRPRTA